MEFFTAPCLCKGSVLIDGIFQGNNKDGDKLHVFQTSEGLHDITMEYLNGGSIKKQTKRVRIAGTNIIRPMEVPFICEL
jgi:hypothetical protein